MGVELGRSHGLRLRVFENRVLRRIFWPKRDGVRREWRKLHNKDLNDMYSTQYCSGDRKRTMRWKGT
jgi:hypothetical protein